MTTVTTIDHKDYSVYDLTFSAHTIYSEFEKYHFSDPDNTAKRHYAEFLQNSSDSKEFPFSYTFPNVSLYHDLNLDYQSTPILLDATLSNLTTISTKTLYSEANKINQIDVNHNPYPIAVRYISENGFYFIERPPFQLNVNLNITHRYNEHNTMNPLTIWIPWTLTLFNPTNPGSMSVYFSPAPLSSEDSCYFPSFLPNTHGNGTICFGNSISNSYIFGDLNNVSNIKYAYSLLLNEYLNGGWNLDLSPNIYSYINIFERIISNPQNFLEKYPTLVKYISINSSDVKKQAPYLSPKRIATILQYYNNSYKDIFKYMFTAMSTFSLQETLNFYQELVNVLQDDDIDKSYRQTPIKFSDILKRTNSQSSHIFYHTYKSSFQYIRSYLGANNIDSISRSLPYTHFSIVITDLKKDPVNRPLNSLQYSYNASTLIDKISAEYLTCENYYTIITYIKNLISLNIDPHKCLIIFSLSNNSIYHIDDVNSSFISYINFINQNYTLTKAAE